MPEVLLSFLVCPRSKQALRPVGQDALESLNRAIRAGQLKNRAGATIGEPLEGGLLREDNEVLYPIRKGIPVLIFEEGIALDRT